MYTILMVDDEEHIRNAFVHAIDWESIGFRIIGEASNGVEALDFIERNDVDLLITDIKMPIMNGIELAREVREIKPNIQMVFLSGHDQFQLAKQAIRYNILEYILKPITKEQILEEFSNIKQKMDGKFSEILDIDVQIDALKELQDVKKELFLSQLITGAITAGQIAEYFANITMNIPDRVQEDYSYVVCVAKFKEAMQPKEVVAYKRLLNIVKIISTKYLPSESFLYGDSIITIAYGDAPTLEKFLDILPKDIILTGKRILNVDIGFVQSNYYTEVSQTHIAFLEATDAMLSIENTEEQIVHIKDMMPNGEDLGVQELLGTLESEIIAGDKDAVQACILQIFAQINAKQIGNADFNAYILEILAVLFKARSVLHDDSEIKSIITKFISFHASKEKMQDEIIDLSAAVVGNILKQRQKAVGLLVADARAIIATEYENPEMNLRLLAERLHCSPNYLSSIIKKTLGKSFVELLVEARMNKAKELLLTTNQKIREISDTCGFANQHYFSYSFKKYFNLSPNAIRKAAAQTESE